MLSVGSSPGGLVHTLKNVDIAGKNWYNYLVLRGIMSPPVLTGVSHTLVT